MRLNPYEERLNIKTNIKMNIPAMGEEFGPDGGPGVWELEWWVGGPLSGILSSLSGIPSPHLVCHPPIWYPIPDGRYPYINESQSGILYSLIFTIVIHEQGNWQ